MKIGLTGGIGSGKTTIANMFRDLGVAVYDSDAAAKRLMVEAPSLREQIGELLGPEAYRDGQLDRAFIASEVFGDREKLAALNALVHPAVREDFKRWARDQTGVYVLQEAAILFENGAHEHYDYMILVTAPEATRIARIIARDGSTEAQVRARMAQQWDDEKKLPLAHFVITNTSLENSREQVLDIHNELLSKA